MKIILADDPEAEKPASVLVDDEDYDLVSGYKWRLNNYGYPVRYEGKTSLGTYQHILMHRQILNAQKGEIVDHKNRIKTDNQKANLRLVTTLQNAYNSRKRAGSVSQYKGVTRVQGRKPDSRLTRPWLATIHKAGVTYRLGYFVTEIGAAQAYDRKAQELFGEFAGLNFPQS